MTRVDNMLAEASKDGKLETFPMKWLCLPLPANL